MDQGQLQRKFALDNSRQIYDNHFDDEQSDEITRSSVGVAVMAARMSNQSRR
jgi:hypothetical protein